ncbi:MAG: hypothetical protein JW900_05975 [Anaerolineae bacterium]|nr:hypothetical protein [Anaerolineae bacterium]
MNADKLVTILLVAALAAVSAGGINAVAPGPDRPDPAAAADALAWHIEALDDAAWGGASLALDAAGQPHITYYDGALQYAHYDGMAWSFSTVDGSGDVGYWNSLALDSNLSEGQARPHVSYRDWSTNDLKYAYHDGTTWNSETVDSAGNVGGFTSLALDGSDLPHISYCAFSPDWDLKYAHYNGTTWDIETVDGPAEVGRYSSLALDAAGRPHIAYYDDSNKDLKYAYHDGSGWQLSTVDHSGDVGQYTSIAIDPLGRPHISYHSGDPDWDLKYAFHDGSTWQIETVDAAGWVGVDTSLAVDAGGQIHIAYRQFGDWDLRYAHYDGAVWRTETVDHVDDVGAFASLAVDAAGRPHIAYYDDTAGDIKYAWGEWGCFVYLPLLCRGCVTPVR